VWRSVWGAGYTAVVPVALPAGLTPGHPALNLYCVCYAAPSGDVAIKAVGTFQLQT
jgi:hypothetical protein